jgi:hypothetical protein
MSRSSSVFFWYIWPLRCFPFALIMEGDDTLAGPKAYPVVNCRHKSFPWDAPILPNKAYNISPFCPTECPRPSKSGQILDASCRCKAFLNLRDSWSICLQRRCHLALRYPGESHPHHRTLGLVTPFCIKPMTCGQNSTNSLGSDIILDALAVIQGARVVVVLLMLERGMSKRVQTLVTILYLLGSQDPKDYVRHSDSVWSTESPNQKT